MSRSPTMLAAASLLLLPMPTALAQQGGGGQQPIPIDDCTTIAESGSYRLTQNLTAAEGAACLVVAADFVTLDLAGWAITGADAAGSGINDGGVARQGIAVRNGTITGFQDGVALYNTFGAVVEAVRAVNNRGTGILASGEGSIVSGNTTRGNGGRGISAGEGSIVSGNTAVGNGEIGIFVGPGSTVSGNTARGNGNEGILVSCPSNVSGNTATRNGGPKNLLLDGSTVAVCNASGNVAPS